VRLERVLAATLVCSLGFALAACRVLGPPPAAPASTATTPHAAAAPADLSGEWVLGVGVAGRARVDSDITLHGPMTLKQTGARISGSYVERVTASQHSGQTGEIRGEYSPPAVSITLTFADGHTAHWRGSVSGDSMEGTLTADSSAGMVWPWRAQRAQTE